MSLSDRLRCKCETCRHAARVDRDGVLCTFGKKSVFKGPVHIGNCVDHAPRPPGHEPRGPFRSRQAAGPARSPRRRRGWPRWVRVVIVGVLVCLSLVWLVWLGRPGERSPLDQGLPVPVAIESSGRLPALSLLDEGEVESWGERISLRALRMARDLVLPTGRLVAGDLFSGAQPAFEVALPAGRYPVVLTRARLPDGRQRVAFARIEIGRRPIDSWLVTGRAGDAESMATGFPVRSGFACYLDASSSGALGRPELLEDLVERTQGRGQGPWFTLDLPGGPGNVAVFEAAPGHYARTYFGFEGDGALAAVVTEFGVLEEPAD